MPAPGRLINQVTIKGGADQVRLRRSVEGRLDGDSADGFEFAGLASWFRADTERID